VNGYFLHPSSKNTNFQGFQTDTLGSWSSQPTNSASSCRKDRAHEKDRANLSKLIITRSPRLMPRKADYGADICSHFEGFQIDDVGLIQASPVLCSKAGRAMTEWHGFDHCSMDRFYSRHGRRSMCILTLTFLFCTQSAAQRGKRTKSSEDVQRCNEPSMSFNRFLFWLLIELVCFTGSTGNKLVF
jgi:hypothetical protein